MVRVKGLKKSFDGCCALDGVDMHVPPGSVYGLVGLNGAGKTTLLRHITGIYRQDAGSVQVEDAPVYENAEVKSRIAFIPDELFYFPQSDTLEMKRFYQGIYPGFNEKLFEKLQEVFWNVDVKRSIRRLSKGTQNATCFWFWMSL